MDIIPAYTHKKPQSIPPHQTQSIPAHQTQSIPTNTHSLYPQTPTAYTHQPTKSIPTHHTFSTKHACTRLAHQFHLHSLASAVRSERSRALPSVGTKQCFALASAVRSETSGALHGCYA